MLHCFIYKECLEFIIKALLLYNFNTRLKHIIHHTQNLSLHLPYIGTTIHEHYSPVVVAAETSPPVTSDRHSVWIPFYCFVGSCWALICSLKTNLVFNFFSKAKSSKKGRLVDVVVYLVADWKPYWVSNFIRPMFFMAEIGA